MTSHDYVKLQAQTFLFIVLQYPGQLGDLKDIYLHKMLCEVLLV